MVKLSFIDEFFNLLTENREQNSFEFFEIRDRPFVTDKLRINMMTVEERFLREFGTSIATRKGIYQIKIVFETKTSPGIKDWFYIPMYKTRSDFQVGQVGDNLRFMFQVNDGLEFGMEFAIKEMPKTWDVIKNKI